MAAKLITLVRNLQQSKNRKRSSLAVAEGIRIVEEALATGVVFEGVVASRALTRTDRGAALLANLAAHAIDIEEVDERSFGRLANTDTPQGIIAVVEQPKFDIADIDAASKPPVLVVDGVQDPGNLGAMLRTAHGLGAPGVILLAGTADMSNAKVVRAAMGASFKLPVVRASDEQLKAWAESNGVSLWIAGTDGTPLDRIDPPANLAVVVGNEGAGVRRELGVLARHRVAIPLARGVESLNVAVAAGIILYEVQRVR